MTDPKINKVIRGFGKFISNLTLSYIDVPDYHHAVVMEFGKFIKSYPPGTYKINRITEKFKLIPDIIIEDNHYGLLCRNGKFIEKLNPGVYFCNPHLNEEILIRDDVVVGEKQKGLLTINNKFIKMLDCGLYQPNYVLNEFIDVIDGVNITEGNIGLLTQYGMFIKTIPTGLAFINKIIGEELHIVSEIVIHHCHAGIKLINGKYIETLEPGRYFANPLLKENIITVDMRVLTKELAPQIIYTKDTTSFTIHSILVYKITDPVKATCNVDKIDFSVRELIKSISQQVLSEHDLDFIMTNKQKLSAEIKCRVDKDCQDWGVQIIGIDIKELIFDEKLKDEMSASAKAKRMADAMMIKANAEVENAKAMKQVADMLDSKSATHMRELETLEKILTKPNVKVLFVAPGLHGLMDDRSLGHIIKQHTDDL